jgi:hypothetical protein
MNEALCTYCADIFRGSVAEWSQSYGQREENSHYDAEADFSLRELSWIKKDKPHHKSISDLRECAERICRLCAAFWSSLLDGERDSWLALDAALLSDQPSASSPSAVHPRTQLHYGISLDLYESQFDIYLEGHHLELAADTGISIESMTICLRPYCKSCTCFLD